MKSDLFKNIIVIMLIFIVAGACSQEQRLQQKDAVILLQPLNNYDPSQTGWLQKEVSSFFDVPVLISPKKTIPSSFINSDKGRRFNANSIIHWLDKDLTDDIIAVAAVTHEDIYTSKRDKSGKVKLPESTYRVWGIFGLGFCPGKSCVVSDKRLFTSGNSKFKKRMRTVVIHEIGHNLGLPHCPQKYCIMNDANETIRTVDLAGSDYCVSCNRRIGRISRLKPK